MSLVDHLTELRKRLIISIAAVAVGAVIGFCMWNWLLDVTTEPYCEAQAARNVTQVAGGSPCQLYITNLMQLLTTRLTVGTYVGLMFALPVVLWQIWRFVTPGLNKQERRMAIPFVGSSMVLFALGAAIAWLTFPRALAFFLAVGGDQVTTLLDPAPYLKFVFLMMVAFGFVFELPVLLVFLQLAGVISSKRLRSWRRYAIVINFAVAAVATPSQDPYSMLAMAVPMCIFYEIAILIGRLCKR